MGASPDHATAGVTVVIPAYNYERFLAEAVDSALRQDYPGEIEVLVVDDGSTDRTAAIAQGYGARVHYHCKANGGLSAARNTGMTLAAHDRVLFLDADDVLEPAAVRRLSEVWDAANPAPVVVGSRGRMIDGDGRFLDADADPEVCAGGIRSFGVADFMLRNRFAPIALADKAVLLGLGGFDPALRASEDRDMWIRAAARGPVLRLDEALHRKRDHGSNMSRQAEQQTQSILQVLQKNAASPMVSPRLKRMAQAVCYYQSARMYLAAGDRRRALAQCLRSLKTARWFSDPGQADLPAFFRFKFLLLLLVCPKKLKS